MVRIENRTKNVSVAIFIHDTHTLTKMHSLGETTSERCGKSGSGTKRGRKRDQRWSIFRMENY